MAPARVRPIRWERVKTVGEKMPPARLTLEKVATHTLTLLSVSPSCTTQVFQSAPSALGFGKSTTFISYSSLSLPDVSLLVFKARRCGGSSSWCKSPRLGLRPLAL